MGLNERRKIKELQKTVCRARVNAIEGIRGTRIPYEDRLGKSGRRSRVAPIRRPARFN